LRDARRRPARRKASFWIVQLSRFEKDHGDLLLLLSHIDNKGTAREYLRNSLEWLIGGMMTARSATLALLCSLLASPAWAQSDDWTTAVAAAKKEGSVVVYDMALGAARQIYK